MLPNWFRPVGFSDAAHEPEIWKPVGYSLSDRYACRDCQHLKVIARLKPDVTVTRARSDLNRVARELIREYPKDYAPDSTISILRFSEDMTGDIRNTLLALFALVGVLLLVAVANVANLFVARATRRTKEIALRLSLGAGPARLFRQMLTESVLISSLGGAVGIGLTYVAEPSIAATYSLARTNFLLMATFSCLRLHRLYLRALSSASCRFSRFSIYPCSGL